jgi:hypothetical protein
VGGWLHGQRPVLFEEVLAELGNRVLITPEAKTTGSMGAIIDALERHGIHQRTVLLQSFSAADCDVAVRRGWDVVLLGSTDYIAAAAAGCEWIGPTHTSVTGPLVSARTRRASRSRATSSTCLARTFMRTTDRFASQTWLPGFQSTFLRRGRGRFCSGGAWGMDLVDSSADWALHGYLTPPDGAASTLDYTLQLDAPNAAVPAGLPPPRPWQRGPTDLPVRRVQRSERAVTRTFTRLAYSSTPGRSPDRCHRYCEGKQLRHVWVSRSRRHPLVSGCRRAHAWGPGVRLRLA